MKISNLLKIAVQASLVVNLGLSLGLGLSLSLGLASVVGSGVAFAGEVSQKSYTVEPGDTLDKVIRKFYPGSPLKIEVLRSMITERNRAAFTKGETKVLMAGAVLSLPDQLEIASSVLSPKGEKAVERDENRGENGLGPNSSNAHRNWVRFP